MQFSNICWLFLFLKLNNSKKVLQLNYKWFNLALLENSKIFELIILTFVLILFCKNSLLVSSTIIRFLLAQTYKKSFYAINIKIIISIEAIKKNEARYIIELIFIV
jgi:hypothetical protein